MSEIRIRHVENGYIVSFVEKDGLDGPADLKQHVFEDMAGVVGFLVKNFEVDLTKIEAGK